MTTVVVNPWLTSAEYQRLAQAWDNKQITLLELQRRILHLQKQFPKKVTRR